MAFILLCTWEGGGHVQPMLLVARDLVRRGHRVRVMSDACNAPEAAALGVAFVSWSPPLSRTDKTPASDRLRDWEADNPMEVIVQLCERVICGPAEAYARDVLAELERQPADLIVTQELLFGAILAAEAAGLPLAILAANIWSFPTLAGVPPFGAGLGPAEDDDQRALHAMVAKTTRTIFQMGLPALNDARAALGLTPLADLLDQLAHAQRILLATSRAFDFAPDPLPEPFRYVGPYVADPVDVAPLSLDGDDERPLVLVSFSSLYQAQEPVIRRVLEALGGLPVRGIVTAGPTVDPTVFSPPANVRVLGTAPHSELLPHAAVFVTHCGHGSTLRPLMAGVPLLCLPMGRDQNDNAARVVSRGAGLLLPPDAGAERIAEALRILLEKPAYRRAAAELGHAITADETARSASEEIEALLA
jgi:MGT family glycosyltransferase